MITHRRIDSLLASGKRRDEYVQWHQGITASEVVRGPWPAHRVVKVNGVRVGEGFEVPDNALVISFDPPAGEAVIYFALFAASFAIGGILKQLLPGPRKRGEIESPNYAFDGVQTAKGDGNPIPKVYGEIRCGGQELTKYVIARGKAGSFLRIVIGFGYGPIQAIAGITADTDVDQPLRSIHTGDLGLPEDIWVGDKRLSLFSNVDVEVRLGNADQEPIRGLELDTQTIPVDRPLTAAEANSSTTLEFMLSLTTPAGSEDDVWETYGIPVLIQERDADYVTILVEYANGLGSQSASTGDITVWRSSVAVRYREVDNEGNPITTGGALGDGYARPRPMPLFSEATTSSISFGCRFPLYDPQTFTLPAIGKLASINFESSFVRAWMNKSSPTIPGAWTTGNPFDEVTIACWFVLRPNGSSTGATSGVDDSSNVKDNPVFSWKDSTNKDGIELCLGTRTFTLSNSQTRTRIVPIVKAGDGTTLFEYYQRNTDGNTSGTASAMGDVFYRCTVFANNAAPTTEFGRCVITYKRNAVGTLDRLRLYAQGVLLMEVIDDLEFTVPSAAFLVCADDLSDGTNQIYFKGHLDELILDHREWTSTDVERDYATGRGLTHAASSTMVGLWHFDDSPAVSGNAAVTQDTTSNNNDLTFNLPTGASNLIRAGSIDSIIEKEEAANVIKRGRYLVEVMRATRDVVNGNRFDDVTLVAVQHHIEQEFSNPGEPQLSLLIRADEQISGTVDNVSAVVQGLKVKVWADTDTPTPSFVTEYSENPAWIALDDATNVEHGMGQVFAETPATLESAGQWALRCEELVYDLKGRTLFDDVDGDAPVSDLYYDSTLFSGFGGILVLFRTGFRPPASWIPGKRIGFRDLPPLGGTYVLDITIDGGFLGHEIRAVTFTGGGWQAEVEFDQATYGDPWADGQFFVTAVGTSVTATIEGREERFAFGGVQDRQEEAWGAHRKICAVGRARPVIDGSVIRWAFEQPVEQAIDLVNMGSIVKGSFEWAWTGGASLPNAYDCQFLDRDNEYQNATEPREDPTLQDTTTLGKIRRGSADAFGMTRRSQVVRQLYWMLARNRLVNRAGKFALSRDSIPYEVGDVVQLAHDMIPRGKSGRIVEDDSTDSVLLDRQVVLAPATTYRLAVRNSSAPAGEDLFELLEVTSAAGTYDIGTPITLASDYSFTPVKDDLWILCADGEELLVRIESISLAKDLKREVEFSLYVEELFDDDALVPDVPLPRK